MNLLDLRTELIARGFDLTTTRQMRYIGRGYTMLCEAEPWPFLEATTTGTAPLTITDLQTVLYVANSTANSILFSADERTIRESDPTLAATGSPECWYLQDTILRTYPPSSDSLTVRYIKVPTALAADTDVPLVPERYQNLIVDAAVYLAYKDTDEFANAADLRTLFDAEVVTMREKLMDRDHQSQRMVLATAGNGNC